jgi:hypothetical protein
MTDIAILDPTETAATMAGHRWGQSNELNQIADSLMTVVDTESSVFAPGLNESNVNALRTKMARRGIKIVVRKVDRNGAKGHILIAKTADA